MSIQDAANSLSYWQSHWHKIEAVPSPKQSHLEQPSKGRSFLIGFIAASAVLSLRYLFTGIPQIRLITTNNHSSTGNSSLEEGTCVISPTKIEFASSFNSTQTKLSFEELSKSTKLDFAQPKAPCSLTNQPRGYEISVENCIPPEMDLFSDFRSLSSNLIKHIKDPSSSNAEIKSKKQLRKVKRILQDLKIKEAEIRLANDSAKLKKLEARKVKLENWIWNCERYHFLENFQTKALAVALPFLMILRQLPIR